MFQVAKRRFVVSQVPEFDGTVGGTTDEHVLDGGVEFDGGDESVVTLIRMN